MKSNYQKPTATEKGTEAAKKKRILFKSMEVFSYKITDNPYDRRNRRKEHVEWHNAFYQARKLMGRPTI